jgi:hypothetical protein
MRVTTYGIGGYDPTKPNNNIVEERIIDDPPQAPLGSVGALAALLAVVGSLTVEDAANAVGLTPADLVAEALAWAAAQEEVGE